MSQANRKATVEFVTYDPENCDTYPSVCFYRNEVEERFGFVGGEILIFDEFGAYIGEVVKQVEPYEVRPDGPETDRGGLIGQEPY